VKQLTDYEIDALEFELVTTYCTTLTEARYNEIMDALLPTLEGFPDAGATLKSHGSDEWRKRRAERSHKTSSAA
jgi:hypothetical protein